MLDSLFMESLGLKSPFSVANIERQKEDGITQRVIFTIAIDKDYRPSKHHIRHSYYEKRWEHISLVSVHLRDKSKASRFQR